MNSSRFFELDKLVQNSLKNAFRSIEPSPDVWNRIESSLDLTENSGVRKNFGASIANLLLRGMRLGDILFTTPGWQAGMVEQQADLCVRISAYPGANIIPLGVI